MGKRFWVKQSIALLCALLLTAGAVMAVSAFGEFQKNCDSLSEKVLRLHVLAKSDSEADQQLTLKVRDAILQESDRLFQQSDSKEAAMAQMATHLSDVEQVAERTLRKNGCDLPVTAALKKVKFNTRTYGNITLPAGEYDALQVEIGAAKGKNWWCVLFPSLCVPSSTNVQMEDVLTQDELQVVEQSGYDVRFKVVEWYEAVKGWIS